MESFDLNGHSLSRIFKGNWQLAGGHGDVSLEGALSVLDAYADNGVNVFDVADIYSGAEALLGEFLKRNAQIRPDREIRVHTKFVPDLDALESLSHADIRAAIERSLHRLGVTRLDLVQLHWWDFNMGDYVEAARCLQQLKHEGLIERIGVTNMDVAHLKTLLDDGLEVVSNQIQFSLLDPRPLNGMLEFANDHDIKLFCYGVLAGGLLTGSRPGDEPTNRSHAKYALMIDEVGEQYYEDTLHILKDLAKKYGTSQANIAAASILIYKEVASIIIGPRNANHVAQLHALSQLRLERADIDMLKARVIQLTKTIKDDVYSYERKMAGPHGRIMKYNLNGMRKRS